MYEQWLQKPATPSADLTQDKGDDYVDLLDFAYLSHEWLEGY